MKKSTFIIGFAVFFIVGFFVSYFVQNSVMPKEEKEMVVGGDRDEYGCLGPAGYSFNSEISVCVREWELDSSEKRKAVKVAAEHIAKDAISKTAYTLIDVSKRDCEGCFFARLEKDHTMINVSIKNWQVIDVSYGYDDFDGAFKNDDIIIVTYPLPGDVVGSPVKIGGEARGYWFFEGDFPIVITDSKGGHIAQGIGHAEGEWMTEEFVPFSAEISFKRPDGGEDSGYIILKKDNPSGIPEYDDSVRIPVMFK